MAPGAVAVVTPGALRRHRVASSRRVLLETGSTVLKRNKNEIRYRFSSRFRAYLTRETRVTPGALALLYEDGPVRAPLGGRPGRSRVDPNIGELGVDGAARIVLGPVSESFVRCATPRYVGI